MFDEVKVKLQESQRCGAQPAGSLDSVHFNSPRFRILQ